jgi:hypothetical protein
LSFSEVGLMAGMGGKQTLRSSGNSRMLRQILL